MAGWDLHPLEKRRLTTAHTLSRHWARPAQPPSPAHPLFLDLAFSVGEPKLGLQQPAYGKCQSERDEGDPGGGAWDVGTALWVRRDPTRVVACGPMKVGRQVRQQSLL